MKKVKWFFLIMALLGDLMIVSAFAYLFYGMPDETNMLIVFSIIIMKVQKRFI